MTTPPLTIEGLKGHGRHEGRIKVFIAASEHDSIILGWVEEGNDIMNTESEMTGSSNPEDYGLDHPPGQGIWVFEGRVIVAWSKCNHPEDPPEYDSDMSWEGEWRPPNDEELMGWRGFRAKHVTDEYKGEGSADAKPAEDLSNIQKGLNEAKSIGRYSDNPPDRRTQSNFCACGKHVSECCCGEDHSPPHHPSGRAYDEEDYEQFYK